MTSLHASKTITRIAHDSCRSTFSGPRHNVMFTASSRRQPSALTTIGLRTFTTSIACKEKKRGSAESEEKDDSRKWRGKGPKPIPKEEREFMTNMHNLHIRSLQRKLERLESQMTSTPGNDTLAFEWTRLYAKITSLQHQQKLFDDIAATTDIPTETEFVREAYTAVTRVLESERRAIYSQMQYASFVAFAPWARLGLIRRPIPIVALIFTFFFRTLPLWAASTFFRWFVKKFMAKHLQ